MAKATFFKYLFFLVLMVNNSIMQAQENLKLSNQQQDLVAISALTASGNLQQLNTVLNNGLNNGLTINEIKEALVQLYAYCGFPKSLNAINTFKTVLEERKAKGITDKEGKRIIADNKVADKYEQGRKVLETLTQTPQPRPAPGFGEFAPRIDLFLKEHLFADVFASDVLSYQQRELVTIAALAAMEGVVPQLQSHINVGKNTGISQSQLAQIAELIEEYVSRTQANTVRKIIALPMVPLIEKDMIVRISEIEIVPEFLEEYKSILKIEAFASIQKEPGVIAIFPMFQKENPAQIRIIEIYANKKAYESHIKTPHFLEYKNTTLKMVKSLQLVDMGIIDAEAMPAIFKKLR